MTYFNQLYRVFILGTLFSLFSESGYSTQYSWTGTTSTAWRTTTNWSPNGIPGSTDTVTITNHTNNPTLSQNETVGKFTLTSGTISLQSYTLTTNGAAKFDGGTITGTASKAVKPRGSRATFDGTTFNAEVDAVCGDIVLSGSIFNYPAWFEQTGSSTGNGAGGNTFNSTAFFKNGGTAYFLLASTNGNTFHDTTTFFGAGTQEIVACKATSYFYGPIILNSTTSAGVNFGASDGDTSYFTSTSSIKIGSSGFSAGTLNLIRFFQLDSTRQDLTLTGTAVLNISYSIFLGSFIATAPSTVLKYTTFNDSLTLTKTGSTAALAAGGNIFNGVTLIKNHSSSQWRFANEVGDTFNNKVTFYTDSTGLLRPFYIETSFVNDDLIATGSKIEYAASTGTVVFGGSKDQHIQGTKAIDFYRIRLDKSAGTVTIDTTVNIVDSLNLKYGNLVSTSNHVLILKSGSKASGNSVSFIDGPVKKIGNSAFTFPIGKEYSYAPAKITAPSSSTDAFTAEYFYNKQQHGSSCDTTLGQFSKCSYWNITRTTGSSSPYVYLGWDTLGCGVSDTTDLKVANWNGSTWKDKGRDSILGNEYSGFIRSGSNSLTYGDFTWAYKAKANIYVTPLFYNTVAYPNFTHSLPEDVCGYNGANTADPGTSWNELAHPISGDQGLLNKSATLLRIPAGTNANYFDWRSGWMIEEKHLPNNWFYLERFLDKDPFIVSGSAFPNEMSEFKDNADLICAKPMFCLNMLSSGFEYQLASLFRAKMLNLSTMYIELGNEFENNNEQYKEKFPSVIDYANAATDWCVRLKNYTQFGTKIAVNGSSTPNGVPGRRKEWLENLMKTLKSSAQVDAVVMHHYMGTGLGTAKLSASNIQTMLVNPFTNWNTIFIEDVNTIDKYKISNSGTESPEVWITEYNLRDENCGSIGTWAHALFVASMTLQYLESPKITKIISHTMNGDANFGNIFSDEHGYDGFVNVPPNITSTTTTDKWAFTAMGSALDLIYTAMKNCTLTKRIDFGGVPAMKQSSSYPSLYGWHFTRTDGDQAIVLNLSTNSTFDLNTSSIFGSGVDLTYEIIYALEDNYGIVGNPILNNGLYNDKLTTSGNVFCGNCPSIAIPPHSMLRIIKKNTSSIFIKAPITTICTGSSTTFEVIGGVLPYSCSTTGGTGTAVPLTASVFQYTGTTAENTEFTVTDNASHIVIVNFIVVQNGSVSATASTDKFCPGDAPITLTAAITPSAGGGTPYYYIWVPDSGVADISTLTTSSIEVTPQRTTNYQVYTFDNVCWNRSNDLVITVPVAEVSLGDDIHICDGNSVDLFCSTLLPDGSSPSYTWLEGGGSTSTGDDNYTSGTLTSSTSIEVSVSNDGCTVSDEINVLVDNCCSCSGSSCIHVQNTVHTTPSSNLISYFVSLGQLSSAVTSYLGGIVDVIMSPGPNPKLIGLTGLAPHTIQIDGELRISSDKNLTFENITFRLGENGKMTVNSGTTVSFINCSFNTCNSVMWEGVIADQQDGYSPPDVTFTNCSMNGAKNAIWLNRNAAFQLEGNTFDENYIDLKIENYQSAVSQIIKNSHPTTNYLRNNIFTGSTTSFLLSPYSSDYKFAAIQVDDVENVIIGDGSYSDHENTFSNSSFGIYSRNSSMELYNNIFQDINIRSNDTHAMKNWGIAIRTSASFDYTDRTVILGNDDSNHSNTIYKVRYGVFVDGEFNTYVRKNQFGHASGTQANDIISIACIKLNNTLDETIDISGMNYFYDYSRGIDIYDVTENAVVNIAYNNFSEPWIVSNTYWNNTAIRISNPLSIPVPSCLISHNEIGNSSFGTRNGIICSNIGKVQISYNNIFTQVPTTPTDYYRGIWLQAADYSYITDNTVTETGFTSGLTDKVIGIFTERSLNCCFDENELYNMGYGMKFKGICYYSNMYENKFNVYDVGVFLENAGLKDQGYENHPNDNEWDNPGVSNDIRVKGTTYGSFPMTWYYDNSLSKFVPIIPALNPDIVNKATVPNDVNLKSCEYLLDDGWDPYDPTDNARNFILGSAIGDSGRYDESYLTNFRYFDIEAAYKLLKNFPTLIFLDNDADDSFKYFYEENDTSNFQLFDSVSVLYSTNNFTEAMLVSLSITDTNDIEEALYLTDSILFVKLPIDSVYSPADSSILMGFGDQDYFEIGSASINANNMLDREMHFLPFAGSRLSKEEYKINSIQFLEVYPTPASENLFIKNFDRINGKSIVIKDLTGRIVLTAPYNSFISIKNMLEGMYLIIVYDGSCIYQSKFIKID